jgi:hypothetical protein
VTGWERTSSLVCWSDEECERRKGEVGRLMWMLTRCERGWEVAARRWWLIAVLQLQVRLMTPEDVTPKLRLSSVAGRTNKA